MVDQFWFWFIDKIIFIIFFFCWYLILIEGILFYQVDLWNSVYNEFNGDFIGCIENVFDLVVLIVYYVVIVFFDCFIYLDLEIFCFFDEVIGMLVERMMFNMK